MQFAEIENRLYLLTSAPDRKKGFFNLLRNLKANNLVSSELLQNLSAMWETRNRIVASAGETTVDETVAEKLQIVKQSLNI